MEQRLTADGLRDRCGNPFLPAFEAKKIAAIARTNDAERTDMESPKKILGVRCEILDSHTQNLNTITL